MADQILLPDLRDDNPYYNGTVFEFDDGSLSLDRTPLVYEKSENDRYYTIGEGESLDGISNQAYFNSKLWWMIADINEVFFPLDLSIGETFVIPDYNKAQIANL
jgi:hypothetical protein